MRNCVILGAPRSGTSMLARALIRAAEVVNGVRLSTKEALAIWRAHNRSALDHDDWLFVHADDVASGAAKGVIERHAGAVFNQDAVDPDLWRPSADGAVDSETLRVYEALVARTERSGASR